ncbi:MAG: N-acetyl-gamma-glutamyl-phosphate reductase [Oscillospiraceae bacterium]|nr:N-acetyl-gamma-glutamyl-phosphate reductase [Oscillospiraceae bacterium]
MTKVFIDGSVGTTGFRIYERLSERKDITLLTLPEETRKDVEARREMLNTAEIVFLCLPDAAAKESVSLIENAETAVIDTSTAHRTDPLWAYGFPELSGRRGKIESSKRIANPGCHASGAIALIAPLVENGIISKEVPFSVTSLTGYSGGGKKMIAEYEAEGRNPLLDAPRMYGLSQSHKHLPEISAQCSLVTDPAFLPIVAPFYSGMEVTIPLFAKDVNGTIADVKEAYKKYYSKGLVSFCDDADEGGFLSAASYSGRDDMEISVFGNDDRILLVSRFDNLGKGASGAAIQNMNIILGVDEKTGLNV